MRTLCHHTKHGSQRKLTHCIIIRQGSRHLSSHHAPCKPAGWGPPRKARVVQRMQQQEEHPCVGCARCHARKQAVAARPTIMNASAAPNEIMPSVMSACSTLEK
eukprot:1160317-Pelagomonas_calceolata.AAC.4